MKHIKEYLSFRDSLNEGPGKGYYIKVAVRDARKALAILDDRYRKKFDIDGSNVYYFKDEDMAYDAKMDLAARDIEITDTNVEESISEAKIIKDLEKIGGQIDYLSDADDATKKIWKKAGFNTEDDNGNHPTIILYSYVNDSWSETKKLLDKSKIKYKELKDPNSAGESFIVFNESLNEEYIESINSIEIANALGKIKTLWDDWRKGPMTEPSDIKPAQKELKGWITRWMKQNIK